MMMNAASYWQPGSGRVLVLIYSTARRHMRKLSTLFLLCLSPLPVFAQFMRGKVVMQDGSAPPQKALIERVCPSAKPVQEAVANKLGEFVWRINNETTAYKLITIGNQMPLRCLL